MADALSLLDGKSATMVPAEVSQRITIGGEQGQSLNLTLFGADAGAIAKPGRASRRRRLALLRRPSALPC